MRERTVQIQREAGQRTRGPRRLWAIAAWIGGAVALFAFALRIARSSPINSDGANMALQSWDMLHGHILLHGWITTDVQYYTFDLPVLAVTELFLGLHHLTLNVASAVAYVIVAISAVALALTNSRGAARVARCAVVVAVLASPVLIPSDVWMVLGLPDHFGTSVFLLVSFLLIDRAPEKRFTAPVVCVILCAGQLGDSLVRYVAVSAIVLVSAYRMVAARKVRTGDAAIAVAALASVPLELIVRAVMVHFGAYQAAPLTVRIASPRQWPHNAALTLRAIRLLFGVVVTPGTPLGTVGAIFGLACLLAAIAGLVKVVWTWRVASRAEQLLCVAIIANILGYALTTVPRLFNPYEIAMVLPCSAVLAARALVPGRIADPLRARAAMAAAAAAALLPLCAAATIGPAPAPAASLIRWLEAHRLTYGLSSYWDGSTTTVESGGNVALRTILLSGRKAGPYRWMTNILWFDPSRHDADFVVLQTSDPTMTARDIERAFGKPASVHHVAQWEVLIYHKNLLAESDAAASTRH